MLNIRVLEKNEEPQLCFVEDAHCCLDYRSLIHRRIEETYCAGERHVPNFNYDQFFAATDTLLDVENILHVAQTSEWPEDQYVGQLWMYGVLQALVVEQDAAKQLIDCFGVNRSLLEEETLKEIRQLRVAAVGHPANHGTELRGWTYLAGRTLGSTTSFEVATLVSFQKFVSRSIDAPRMILQQRSLIQKHLAGVWNSIRNNPKFDRRQ